MLIRLQNGITGYLDKKEGNVYWFIVTIKEFTVVSPGTGKTLMSYLKYIGSVGK
jgi:hypothetical protein